MGWPAAWTQPGTETLAVLAEAGATVEPGADGMTVTGPDALRGVGANLHDASELTPTVAAVAALATGVRGSAGWRTSAAARPAITALAAEIDGLGGHVVETPDGLEIRPASLRGGPWRAYADQPHGHGGGADRAGGARCRGRRRRLHREDHPRLPARWADPARKVSRPRRYDETQYLRARHASPHEAPPTTRRPRRR